VLDDYRTYALDLLGDILLNSIFPPENLEREKQAILREIATARDLPNERAHALLKASAWNGHALGRPISGRPETVKPLTREDVIYFVHEHYLPDRMIVAAAGNVAHDDFVALARDAFWRMLGQSDIALPFIPLWRQAKEGRPIFRSGVELEHMPVSQVYFSLGLRAHPYAHPDRYALHVISSVLGGGISSRLFRKMREERGMVYDIRSAYHAYGDDGLLVVEGSTAPEYFIQVLGLTLAELCRLISGEDPIDEEELWKANMHIRGQHVIAAENTNTRMSRLATQELYFGRHIPGQEVLHHIESVDARALEGLSAGALTEALGRLTIAVVGPEASGLYNASAIEELVHGFHI
jgi:predicted Zn-dependent peptidase